VRFDDRLMTVLAQPTEDPHDRAVRWRQLVDLLAHAGPAGSPLTETARHEVAAEAQHIDEQVRAAAARAISTIHVPLPLIELFAADSAHVAAPLLAAAELDETALRRVFDAASADTRRFLVAMHPQLGGGPSADAPAQPPRVAAPVIEVQQQRQADAPPVPRAENQQMLPSINELLERIERIRHLDEGAPAAALAPPPQRQEQEVAAPPLRSEEPGLFRWESNPSGEIAWVEGVPRGALIGRSLAPSAVGEGVDPSISQAFARRASFHGARLSLVGEGDAAGEWQMSGAPAFDPGDGRFAGYRGFATLERQSGPPTTAALREETSEHDSVRELVHELKTPLNAIIGFAEMIDGQYLGPANDRYRARAAEIVGQARLLVTAIDELDIAARLQSGREPGVGTAAAGDVLRQLSAELRERAADRGARLDIDDPDPATSCAIHPAVAEQLMRRFGEAVIDLLAPGEQMDMRLQLLGDRCSLLVAIPAALRGEDAEELLAGAPARGDDEPDPFFWLRLVRGLARLTGGELVATDGNLSLILPEASDRG
jgi:hypothetical protein